MLLLACVQELQLKDSPTFLFGQEELFLWDFYWLGFWSDVFWGTVVAWKDPATFKEGPQACTGDWNAGLLRWNSQEFPATMWTSSPESMELLKDKYSWLSTGLFEPLFLWRNSSLQEELKKRTASLYRISGTWDLSHWFLCDWAHL